MSSEPPPVEASTGLRPEQERALGYARRRGTQAPAGEVRDRVRATYDALAALVAEIPADLAARRPAPDAWSVHEVVDHLAESDRRAAGQLEQLLAGQPVDEPIPAALQSRDPLSVGWDALRRELRHVHGRVLDALAGAGDATALDATAPVVMVVKCADPDGSLRPVHWLERFDWKAFAILLHAHNREHMAQIQRTLAALVALDAAPEPGPPPAG